MSLFESLFTYQVALVSWTESVALALVKRDLTSMTLRTPTNSLVRYRILQTFPFTSETKRMGIIVKVNLFSYGKIAYIAKQTKTFHLTKLTRYFSLGRRDRWDNVLHEGRRCSDAGNSTIQWLAGRRSTYLIIIVAIKYVHTCM